MLIPEPATVESVLISFGIVGEGSPSHPTPMAENGCNSLKGKCVLWKEVGSGYQVGKQQGIYKGKGKQTPTWCYQIEVRTITEMGIMLTRGIKEGAPSSTWRNLERLLEGGADDIQVDKEAKDERGDFRQRKKARMRAWRLG